MYYKILILFLLIMIASGCDNSLEQNIVESQISSDNNSFFIQNNSNLQSIINDDSLLENLKSKLQISFKNNSPYNLVNLTVANLKIGSLESGARTYYLSFEKFMFDTGMPDEDISAEVNGIFLTNIHGGHWCRTEKISADSGKYLIEIDVLDTLLYMSCENGPRIFYS